MAKLYRYICECADAHAENGDESGAEAIMYAARHGVREAIRRFPHDEPAVRNAWAYAHQEAA